MNDTDQLTLQAEIDCCLWQLSELARRPAGSPIEAMIDAACGRDGADRQAAVDLLRVLLGLWRRWQEATGEDMAATIAATERSLAAVQIVADTSGERKLKTTVLSLSREQGVWVGDVFIVPRRAANTRIAICAPASVKILREQHRPGTAPRSVVEFREKKRRAKRKAPRAGNAEGDSKP